MQVKIIDFGSAADRDPRLPLREFRGTWLYAAPEALRREDIFVRETEVWSLGILFSVLLLGKSIFKNQDATLAGRYSRRDFESLPKGCQDVLRCCLAHKPQHRISIANLCRHPYLRSAVQSYELKINQTE